YLDRHNRGVEPRALLDSNDQNRGDNQRDYERRKVEAYFMSKNRWRIEQCVRSLQQFGRRRLHDEVHFIEKRLRPWPEGYVRGLRHLSGDELGRRVEPCPMVIGQPQRHLDVKYIQ